MVTASSVSETIETFVATCRCDTRMLLVTLDAASMHVMNAVETRRQNVVDMVFYVCWIFWLCLTAFQRLWSQEHSSETARVSSQLYYPACQLSSESGYCFNPVCLCVSASVHKKTEKLLIRNWCNVVVTCVVKARTDWLLVTFDLDVWPWAIFVFCL